MSESPLVLVVDDDEAVRRGLARLLRAAGLEARTFASAQALVSTELPDRPICMIVDLRMPNMSGLELQDWLRRANYDAHLVFLSGHGDVGTATHAMKAGAVDFLQKPVDEERLLEAVERAIRRATDTRIQRMQQRQISERIARLTARERQVLTYVISGWLNKQVARQLGVTEKTVKVHRARVMTKMGADSLAELVRMAASVGVAPVSAELRRAPAPTPLETPAGVT